MSAAEPLQLLRDIAHNFPPIANSLARLRVDADVRSEIEDNQEQLAGLHHLPGNFINMNGRTLAAEQLSPYVYCSPQYRSCLPDCSFLPIFDTAHFLTASTSSSRAS